MPQDDRRLANRRYATDEINVVALNHREASNTRISPKKCGDNVAAQNHAFGQADPICAYLHLGEVNDCNYIISLPLKLQSEGK